MAQSKNLYAYTDIHAVLDKCVESGGQMSFKTKGAATNWRSRANYYRTLLHKQQREQALVEHPITSTPYDHLVFTSPADYPHIVNIGLRVVEATLITPAGTFDVQSVIEGAQKSQVENQRDELDQAAEDFAAGFALKTVDQ